MIHIVYSRQGILWIKLSIYISYVVSLSAPLLFGGLFLNLMFGGGFGSLMGGLIYDALY